METFYLIVKSIVSVLLDNYIDVIITIILGIMCLILKKYYPKFRGFMGEFWVKIELNKLTKNKYIVLNNIMLETEGETCQIDHIILSKFGIFVIEMKNYYGLIKGREYDHRWCQYLGKNKYYFMNPIHQNYGHIKVLSKILKLEEKYFVSIICFSNQIKFKIDAKTSVVQLDKLVNEITKYNEIILDSDLNKFKEIIITSNIIDRKLRKKHIESIQRKINTSNQLVNNNVCSKCGGQLIEKKGKYGKFIGCSNFPKCKFIKKVRK